jgi:hypothetical protein
MKNICIAAMIVFFTSSLLAQDGKICFIRQTGYVSSAVNFKVYINDTLVCKLKNKTFSIHSVAAGEHTVSASNTGISDQRKSPPFKVTVTAGKITYVDVVWANKVTTQELTESSGKQKTTQLRENLKCSSAEE